MTPNEYQKEALRTEPSMITDEGDETHFLLRLIHGALGVAGEAGEVADIVKKDIFHGHDLDKEHLAKELGDVCWYLAVTADVIGYDFETILKMNIEKLRARYPDGFSSERSINRDPNDI